MKKIVFSCPQCRIQKIEDVNKTDLVQKCNCGHIFHIEQGKNVAYIMGNEVVSRAIQKRKFDESRKKSTKKYKKLIACFFGIFIALVIGYFLLQKYSVSYTGYECYKRGLRYIEKNPKQGVYYFSKGAELEFIPCIDRLALIYMNGIWGCERDYSKARKLYAKMQYLSEENSFFGNIATLGLKYIHLAENARDEIQEKLLLAKHEKIYNQMYDELREKIGYQNQKFFIREEIHYLKTAEKSPPYAKHAYQDLLNYTIKVQELGIILTQKQKEEYYQRALQKAKEEYEKRRRYSDEKGSK